MGELKGSVGRRKAVVKFDSVLRLHVGIHTTRLFPDETLDIALNDLDREGSRYWRLTCN